MKRYRWLLVAAVVIVVSVVSVAVAQSVIGRRNESNKVFYNEESLTENENSTFVSPSEDPTLVSKYLIEERDLRQQVEESSIIVKGKVVKILGTTETKDMEIPQGMRVHTDVLFKVDQYLGPNSLPYENLVLRRMGGKIEGFTHIVNQENLTVGEELIIFRLTRPEFISQLPDGYCLEQYYLFNPASKFIKTSEGLYRASYMDKSYSLDEITKASSKAKPLQASP